MNVVVDPAGEVQSTPNRVTVVDFDMPFGSMVLVLVKLSLAVIPALAILAIFGFLVAGVLSMLGTLS